MGTNVTPLRFAWLEITGKCQLSCAHCYAESGPTGTHGAMSGADWHRVIDQAADLGVRMVQFIGGEPTLHPDLPELVDHACGCASRSRCSVTWSA
jgi:MoaA/NifB/PqqE/SkfB family radical SAM enzyme